MLLARVHNFSTCCMKWSYLLFILGQQIWEARLQQPNQVPCGLQHSLYSPQHLLLLCQVGAMQCSAHGSRAMLPATHVLEHACLCLCSEGPIAKLLQRCLRMTLSTMGNQLNCNCTSAHLLSPGTLECLHCGSICCLCLFGMDIKFSSVCRVWQIGRGKFCSARTSREWLATAGVKATWTKKKKAQRSTDDIAVTRLRQAEVASRVSSFTLG